MNPSQIYTEATTPQSVKDARESNQLKQQADKTFQAGMLDQNRQDWLSNKYTSDFLARLEVKAGEDLNEVINSSDNLVIGSQEKLNKLIAIKTLKKVINYARTGKYNND